MSWLSKAPGSSAPTQAPQPRAQTPVAQSNGVSSIAERLRALADELNARFVGREREIRAAVIALASGEPMYWEAPPGTAKTSIVETLASLIGGRYFYYQAHEFAEPDEVLGPLDVVALRERGEYRRITTGYLPEADIVFIDEIYRASGAFLNMLIDVILNKRVRIGSSIVKLPTVAMYFAANFRRSEEEFAAFHDRLVLRIFSNYLNDKSKLRELIGKGLELLRARIMPAANSQLLTVDEVRKFQQIAQLKAAKVVEPVIDKIVDVVTEARSANIPVSDRRAVKLAYVVAVVALMDGRNTADEDDVAEAARLVLPIEVSDLDRVETIIQKLGLDKLAAMRSKLSQLIDEAKRLAATIHKAYGDVIEGREPPAEISDILEAFKRTAEELNATLREVSANPKYAKLLKQYRKRLEEAKKLIEDAIPVAKKLAARL